MAYTLPTLTDGPVTVRPIRSRDARVLDETLMANRDWLSKWEATLPGYGATKAFDTKATIRNLIEQARNGDGLPFSVEYEGEFAGQVNVSGITSGALSSASIGYWVGRRYAGHNITPTAVALVTDYCLFEMGLHRMEVCIRPENLASLRVVEKLGFRFEGLRRRYIHIDGDWRDHLCFALVREELHERLLQRWKRGQVPVFDRSVYPVEIGGRP
ncbi:GNAT family N-acetyltransferase [Humidisolicoccus flavus]|uniref:GNAT family N-acetyltransferase n=1 Tax=Humidisolicoccus flavus TaxID=3111414 RepID=UPI003249E3CB